MCAVTAAETHMKSAEIHDAQCTLFRVVFLFEVPSNRKKAAWCSDNEMKLILLPENVSWLVMLIADGGQCSMDIGNQPTLGQWMASIWQFKGWFELANFEQTVSSGRLQADEEFSLKSISTIFYLFSDWGLASRYTNRLQSVDWNHSTFNILKLIGQFDFPQMSLINS